MQEYTLAINIECVHGSLQAKLLMHNCAHAKRTKTCFCSIKIVLKVQSSGIYRVLKIYSLVDNIKNGLVSISCDMSKMV